METFIPSISISHISRGTDNTSHKSFNGDESTTRLRELDFAFEARRKASRATMYGSVTPSGPSEVYIPPEGDDVVEGQRYYDKDRWTWYTRLNLLFHMIGLAVGLSNINIFPYLVFKHGGINFLVPYLICLTVIVFPIIYLELLIGQFTQSGMIRTFTRLIPIFQGIGWTQCIFVLVQPVHEGAMLMWALQYCVGSIGNTEQLPWVGCFQTWNTRKCRDIPADFEAVDVKKDEFRAGAEYFRGKVQRRWTSVFAGDYDEADLDKNGNGSYGYTTTDGAYLNGIGFPSVESFSYYVLVAVIVYLFFFRGLRLKGRFIWITVAGPYLFIIIIIFRAVAVPGASSGLWQIFTFDTSKQFKFFDLETWKDAAAQAIFSIDLGMGVHMTLASYSKFNYKNAFKDALIVIFVDTLISISCCVIIFSAVGSIASSDTAELKEVFAQGPDLLFETCADFWGRLPASEFFSFIFYVVIFIIGLETMAIRLTAAQAALFESCGDWLDRNGRIRWVFVNTCLLISFLVGALCTTRGGLHVYILFNKYSTFLPNLMNCLFALVGLAWFWGLREICDAAEAMTGKRPNVFLQFCWKFVTPLALLIVLFSEFITAESPFYEDRGQHLPFQRSWAAWVFFKFLSFFGVLLFILGIIAYLRGKDKLPWKMRFLLGISPNYEHQDILDNKTGRRAEASHYLYMTERPACFRRKAPLAKVTPEKEDAEGNANNNDHHDPEQELRMRKGNNNLTLDHGATTDEDKGSIGSTSITKKKKKIPKKKHSITELSSVATTNTTQA